jgi:hypothetical protein
MTLFATIGPWAYTAKAEMKSQIAARTFNPLAH